MGGGLVPMPSFNFRVEGPSVFPVAAHSLDRLDDIAGAVP